MVLLLLIEARRACGQNDIVSPQKSPTMEPTLSPSLSVSPTVSPPPSAHSSASPSAHPTLQPSISYGPTISPKPSSHPSSTPTAMPSINRTTAATRFYTQTFQAKKELESGEVAIFQKVMESYTETLEYGVTDHIVTHTTFVSQIFNDTTSLLSINYAMNYTTKYIYEYPNIKNYPEQFYASQNMTVLTEQLVSREFPPELLAIELVMLDEGGVTTSAFTSSISTISPSRMITRIPTKDYGASLAAGDAESIDNDNLDENQPDAPTNTDPSSNSEANDIVEATQQNTDISSTAAPSPSLPIDNLSTNTDQIPGKSGLGVGLGVGIFVAAVVSVGLFFTWRFHKKERTSTSAARSTADANDQEIPEAPQDNPLPRIINSEGMESPKSFEFYRPIDVDLEAAQTDSNPDDSFKSGATAVQDNFSMPMPMLIADLDGSETSSDFLGEFSVDEDADIFDNYKNDQLEELREGVTSIVADTEGSLSLAMTQSLIDDSDLTAEDILDGAGNPGEIEANFLFETNDWLKKNRQSPVDTHDFFQEILNKTVVIVRNGVMHGQDATRLIYYCAAILGLTLLRDFPNDTLLVSRMRKTNDASQGRTYLVDAFEEFGAIESAAVAIDKGFGFVRFVQPTSVDLVLERFRTAEIEVQGVSVMISMLRLSDR
jgi:hypothetical protein